ncbi:MAG TPA: hypothetical protein VFT74_10250 [Isosphaeraceae bacterium]|nr:hypothetical protein [Isosphaeraceae bacterium]
MPRSSWLLVLLAGVALAATGCAHCDTCDELPLPCPSGDCGMGMMGGPIVEAPVVMAPTMVTAPAPAVIQSQPAGPGSQSSKPAGSGSSSMPSPLPPSPGVQSPPFSTGPSAPR